MAESDLKAIETSLTTILNHSTLFPGRHLTVDIILNPCAGAFSPASRLERVSADLADFTRGLIAIPRDPALLDVRFHHTRAPGHATEIANELIDEAAPDLRLVVSAGGDGTHGEVLTAALHDSRLRGSRKGRLWFFRFPFGTGNDGADADTPAKAARALLGDASPGAAGHLVVRSRGTEPRYAFNIASVGLDAYVAMLTNRLKGSLAGDLYKFLADIVTLFYESIVGMREMTIRFQDGDGGSHDLRRPFVLCAMGVGGERTYGDHKPILPGFENVCAIETTGLIGKVRLKGLVYRGAHPGWPIVHMKTSSRLIIEYEGRLPIQLDGEAWWLEKENFPLEIDLHDDSIPILEFTG